MNGNMEARRHPAQQGLLGKIFGGAARTVAWLVGALVLSVLVEWAGMVWWWTEEGPMHSRTLLAKEIEYLNRDFRHSVIASKPARLAQRFADGFHHWLFEVTRVIDFVRWLKRPATDGENRIHRGFRVTYARMADLLVAAMTIAQVFAVRLAALTLATPVFGLFALVAVVDGLVQRDLRRWGGGRESSFVYHHAKKAILPALVLTWVVYLAMPSSVQMLDRPPSMPLACLEKCRWHSYPFGPPPASPGSGSTSRTAT